MLVNQFIEADVGVRLQHQEVLETELALLHFVQVGEIFKLAPDLDGSLEVVDQVDELVFNVVVVLHSEFEFDLAGIGLQSALPLLEVVEKDSCLVGVFFLQQIDPVEDDLIGKLVKEGFPLADEVEDLGGFDPFVLEVVEVLDPEVAVAALGDECLLVEELNLLLLEVVGLGFPDVGLPDFELLAGVLIELAVGDELLVLLGDLPPFHACRDDGLGSLAHVLVEVVVIALVHFHLHVDHVDFVSLLKELEVLAFNGLQVLDGFLDDLLVDLVALLEVLALLVEPGKPEREGVIVEADLIEAGLVVGFELCVLGPEGETSMVDLEESLEAFNSVCSPLRFGGVLLVGELEYVGVREGVVGAE